ncbi:MAG TPA: single-stranded-DNA-specific exonuclease RecJ [Candidatus Limnocylindrales bacterium]
MAQPVTPTAELLDAGARHRLGERVVGLLATRGIVSAAELDAFFAEPLAGLHDPALLPDAAVFRDRIRAARGAGERVMVFGDFDADGLTGMAILVRALRRLGVDVLPYVPSRLDEGHGLSRKAIERAIEAHARVIVTVDCGSTSVAEIAAANAAGLDVVVTDHHRVPHEPPAALALVNPQRPDSRYPERRLAGSGVAFKLAQLLLADEPGGVDAALGLADLAAIGSIADLIPILGETRAIVRLGLAAIAKEPRPGVAALLAAASVLRERVDVETLSFAVAPRINAAGRVGESEAAASLLLTDDREEADRLAAELETANRSRRDLTSQAIAEARAALEAVPPGSGATIVRGAWPVGIVGLVASKLVDDHGRPAIVGAELGEVIRASCRSDGRLDLGAALESCSALFLRHGGHAGAAGFEIATERWPEFVEVFGALAERAVPADPRQVLPVDAALAALDVDYPLQRDLARLAPCGTGNPEPLLLIRGLTVTRVRSASGGHSQLTLRRRLDVLDGIAFGRPDLAESVAEGAVVDVVARLGSRSFGGYESLQLEIRDVASAGLQDAAAAVDDAIAIAPAPHAAAAIAVP